MSLVQFRGFATKGILKDPFPYQLANDAFSGGSNVRFHANRAERAPVFKTYLDALPEAPVYATNRQSSSGNDQVFTIAASGTIRQITAGAAVTATPAYALYPTITNAGMGYLEGSPPAVTVSAPPTGAGSRTAVATASVNAAAEVINIVFQDVGAGYTSAPTLTLAAPPSTANAPVTATATCSWVAYAPSAGKSAWTSTFLGDVAYLNNPGGLPYFCGPSSATFSPLPDWHQDWSCRSMRAYGDYLLALNVTKATGAVPSMVKWSDLTLAGLPPDSWDADDFTTSAGENVLEELLTPLVDGAPMRSIFILYSEDQIFSMAANGTQEIFSFSRLFGDGGLIAPNCVVEVEGVHYCFGPKDIYRHDSVSKASILDGRNRDYVYNNLDVSKTETFFAFYSQQFASIFFCYVDSSSGDAAYQGTPYPNRAAVFDLTANTWSFVDLPNCSAGFVTSIDTGVYYAAIPNTTTYATWTGTYADLGGRFTETPVFSSVAFSGAGVNSRILAYDFINKGVQGGLTALPEVNPAAWLERTGIALDTEGSDLTTYKTVRRVYPQIGTFTPAPMQLQFGASQTPSGAITWGALLNFDPSSQYKVDLRLGGRYLAFRIVAPSIVDFAVAGFDADITSAGRR